jgi:hypothetical protein
MKEGPSAAMYSGYCNVQMILNLTIENVNRFQLKILFTYFIFESISLTIYVRRTIFSHVLPCKGRNV